LGSPPDRPDLVTLVLRDGTTEAAYVEPVMVEARNCEEVKPVIPAPRPTDRDDEPTFTLVLRDGTTVQAAHLEQVMAEETPAVERVMLVERREGLCCLLTLKTVLGTSQLAPEALHLTSSTARTVREATSDPNYLAALNECFWKASKRMVSTYGPCCRLIKCAILSGSDAQCLVLNADGSLNREGSAQNLAKTIDDLGSPPDLPAQQLLVKSAAKQ